MADHRALKVSREAADNWGGWPTPRNQAEPAAVQAQPFTFRARELSSQEKSAGTIGRKSGYQRSLETFLKFGKYNGHSIAQIARTIEGLTYLNWLLVEKQKEDRRTPTFIQAMLEEFFKESGAREWLENNASAGKGGRHGGHTAYRTGAGSEAAAGSVAAQAGEEGGPAGADDPA
jgi:hypothetical protein